MFEQAIIEDRSKSQGLSLLVSCVAQVALLAFALILPLVFTYEIPLDRLVSTSFLLAPPPPPPPPAPPPVKIEIKQAPARFDEVMRQPTAIPDKVAFVDDRDQPRVSLAAAPGIGVAGGVPQGIPGGIPVFASAGAHIPPPPKPIRIGGRIQSARLLHRVSPSYPEEALVEQVSGTVKLEAIIAADGAIRDLSLISGHPMLAPAAIEAVSQWRYKPTLLNGGAVEVVTNIDVIFNIDLIDEKELKRRRKQQEREQRRRAPG